MDELMLELVESEKDMAIVEAKITKAIAKLEIQKKTIAEKNTEIREKLKLAMEEKGITGYDNDYLSITYVAPFTKKTVDSKVLKSKYPDIYEECSKTSEVSSSIRIKVKENENE